MVPKSFRTLQPQTEHCKTAKWAKEETKFLWSGHSSRLDASVSKKTPSWHCPVTSGVGRSLLRHTFSSIIEVQKSAMGAHGRAQGCDMCSQVFASHLESLKNDSQHPQIWRRHVTNKKAHNIIIYRFVNIYFG